MPIAIFLSSHFHLANKFCFSLCECAVRAQKWFCNHHFELLQLNKKSVVQRMSRSLRHKHIKDKFDGWMCKFRNEHYYFSHVWPFYQMFSVLICPVSAFPFTCLHFSVVPHFTFWLFIGNGDCLVGLLRLANIRICFLVCITTVNKESARNKQILIQFQSNCIDSHASFWSCQFNFVTRSNYELVFQNERKKEIKTHTRTQLIE